LFNKNVIFIDACGVQGQDLVTGFGESSMVYISSFYSLLWGHAFQFFISFDMGWKNQEESFVCCYNKRFCEHWNYFMCK